MKLIDMKINYLSYVKATKAAGTYTCYLSHLNSFFKFLDENNIIYDDEINEKLLLKYIYKMHDNNVLNSTINKRFKPLKLMFEFNEIYNKSVEELKLLKEQKNHYNSLNSIELNKLLNYLNNSKLILKNKTIIFLIFETGVRINELLNIKVKNINFTNNSIYLDKTKSSKARFVYFRDGTAALLKAYIKTITTEKLFYDKYKAVYNCLQRIKKHLNLNKLHPHMFRRTFASVLHKNGISIFVLKTLMGHENIKTTERYVDFDDEFIQQQFIQNMNY
ncbi:MAG: site-specific integrase [Mycoplasmataceae bacterium]|nr:site-specific integrase [Mycoplasmataceae bacterium]